MPNYQFTCTHCEDSPVLQLTLSQYEDFGTSIPCYKCGQGFLKPVIGNAGFVLRGSGWEKDGYGGKK